MKNYLAIILIIFIVSSLSSQEARADPAQATRDFVIVSSMWGSPSQPIEVGPGSINTPFTIQLLYQNSVPLRFAQLKLLLPRGITSEDGYNSAEAYLPALSPGTLADAVFRLNVGEELKTGSYAATLIIVGERSDDTSFSYTFPLSLKIYGKVVIRVTSIEKTLVAGQRNYINISITNEGTGMARRLELTISSAQQVSILSYPSIIEKVESGESVLIPVELYVAPTLAGSPVTLSVSLYYIDSYGYDRTWVGSLGYEVSYPQSPNILIEAKPSQLNMYMVNELRLFITNAGQSPIKDVSVTIYASPPLVPVGTDGKFSLRRIGPGENVELPFLVYVDETTASSSQLTVNLNYLDDSNQLRTESRVLNIFLTAKFTELLSPLDIKVVPSILYSGRVNNLTVRVVNVGSTILRAVTITPSTTSQATWLQDNIVTIPSLEPGDEYAFKAGVFIPPDSPTSIAIPFTIRYYGQDNIQKLEDRQVGILVKGLIRFEVADYTLLPEMVSPGQTFSVTLVLVNTGTVQALATSIRPESVQGLRAFGQARVFLGNVPTNTPTTVTFSFTVLNTTMTGRRQLSFTILYIDNVGEAHSDTLSIPIEVRPSVFGGQMATRAQAPTANTTFTSIPNVVLAAFTLLAGVAIGAVLGRRGKK